VVYQWSDTAYRADANLDGNPRVISIETGDNAPGLVRDIKPWTAKQLDAIVKLVAWICKAHNIPPVLIHDSRPGTRGIGFHQLGCEHSDGVGSHADFLVSGGERWSKSLGKECPGPQRIAQVKTIIVPRVKALLAAPEEIDVASLTLKDVLGMEFVLSTQFQVDQMNALGANYKVGDTFTLLDYVRWGGPGDQRALHELRDVAADVNSTQAALAALDKQVPDDLPQRLTALEAAAGRIPADLVTRLQVIQDGLAKLLPATPTGNPTPAPYPTPLPTRTV
jgi:catechol 2,3-dioxygenase-like lactoylglutathione lyase family enzyme